MTTCGQLQASIPSFQVVPSSAMQSHSNGTETRPRTGRVRYQSVGRSLPPAPSPKRSRAIPIPLTSPWTLPVAELVQGALPMSSAETLRNAFPFLSYPVRWSQVISVSLPQTFYRKSLRHGSPSPPLSDNPVMAMASAFGRNAYALPQN